MMAYYWLSYAWTAWASTLWQTEVTVGEPYMRESASYEQDKRQRTYCSAIARGCSAAIGCEKHPVQRLRWVHVIMCLPTPTLASLHSWRRGDGMAGKKDDIKTCGCCTGRDGISESLSCTPRCVHFGEKILCPLVSELEIRLWTASRIMATILFSDLTGVRLPFQDTIKIESALSGRVG